MIRLALALAAILLCLVLGGVAITQIQASRIAARFPAEGRFVETSGGRLHFVDYPARDPSAPTLLMIHGASSNHAELPLALRAALGDRYRIISVDRPGHGWSERADGRAAASPARQAALMSEALAKIGAPPAIVVAHSMAGAAALNLALDHPQRVAGLVLIAPVSHPWPGGVAWYYPPAADGFIGPWFANTISLPFGLLLLDAGVNAVFAPQSAPANYAEAAKISLVLRPAVFQANAQDVTALKAFVTLQAPRYSEISTPTAIVAGEEDGTVSPQIHARALAAQIRGAELTLLPGVGHAPHHSAPDIVVKAIDGVAQRVR